MTILVSEHRGAYSGRATYRVGGGGTKGLEVIEDVGSGERKGQGSGSAWTSWARATRLTLRQIFLPNGYPSSVSSDYMTYQAWDTLQAFASSITGALGTEAVMRGVGVGSLGASPLAAAMTWLLKQGTGMIGRIVFAWAKGSALDYDNKKWRLFADVLNDVATLIDLLAPLFPSDLVVIVFCGSSLARSLVGVAGGATRASITVHQARAHNCADVSAKDGSQETLVNLLSLSVSLMILPAVSGNFSLIWTLFAFFTCVHVGSNYGAVRSLQFESFNTSRLLLALRQYLTHSSVPTIREVNRQESVVLGTGISDIDVCGYRIRLGVSFGEAVADSDLEPEQLQALIQSSNSFILIPNVGKRRVHVVLGERISGAETVEAFAKAVFLAARSQQQSQKSKSAWSPSSLEGDWDLFRRLVIGAGYDLPKSTLQAGDWRAKWTEA